MKFISILLVPVLLCSCFLFGPTRQKFKTLYNKTIDGNESIKIVYSNIPYNKSFTILVHKNRELTDQFEITDVPQRFVVTKMILSEKGSRSLYRMISDSSNRQLRSIDFNFLENQNNRTVVQSFVSITQRERELFSVLAKVIAENNIAFGISESEINRFIGWVKLYFSDDLLPMQGDLKDLVVVKEKLKEE